MALYFLHRTRILCNIIVLCAAVLKEYFMCYLNEILFFYHISCVNFCISYLPENHVNVLYESQLDLDMRFPTMWYVRLAMAQTSLKISCCCSFKLLSLSFTVIFLQICFYESRDSLGQNSLHPKLEVLHPIWGPL